MTVRVYIVKKGFHINITEGGMFTPVAKINALRDRFVEQLAPLRIYLFDSYAEGTDTEESDFVWIHF